MTGSAETLPSDRRISEETRTKKNTSEILQVVSFADPHFFLAGHEQYILTLREPTCPAETNVHIHRTQIKVTQR